MRKLTKSLKNDIPFTEKLQIIIPKKEFNTDDLKILREFFGVVNYTQVFQRGIEFFAFNKIESTKELMSQITYNKKIAIIIDQIRNTLVPENVNSTNDFYTIKIDLWKTIICLNYFQKSEYQYNDATDFLKVLIEKNIEVYYNLFPEKRC